MYKIFPFNIPSLHKSIGIHQMRVSLYVEGNTTIVIKMLGKREHLKNQNKFSQGNFVYILMHSFIYLEF